MLCWAATFRETPWGSELFIQLAFPSGQKQIYFIPQLLHCKLLFVTSVPYINVPEHLCTILYPSRISHLTRTVKMFLFVGNGFTYK